MAGFSGLNFNPFDSAALTQVINRPLENRFEGTPSIGEQICPLLPVHSREVKVTQRDVRAFGKGQYRAPGATPALYEPSVEYKETMIELVLEDEMHRIKDEDWLALQSSDVNYRKKAGVELVERGQILALRNRRLTEHMRWKAFSGGFDVEYPTGSILPLDYGIPADHKPNASVDWSDTENSDPIKDLKTWQFLSSRHLGVFGVHIHLSSEAWELMLKSKKLKDMLTGVDRPLFVPTEDDVLTLLRAGTKFHIVDEGYRAETVTTSERNKADITRYLPKDKVLVTTEYSVDGERIADMPDGQVIVSTGYNQVAIRQGAQAEILLEHISKTHLLRYASARVPRILQPHAFVYADVGTVPDLVV